MLVSPAEYCGDVGGEKKGHMLMIVFSSIGVSSIVLTCLLPLVAIDIYEPGDRVGDPPMSVLLIAAFFHSQIAVHN